MYFEKEKEVHINNFNNLIAVFPRNIQNKLYNLPDDIKQSAQEIRVNTNLKLICENKKIINLNLSITLNEINEIFKNICKNSAYSFQEQLKQGFINFKGGHRIGISSSAIIENGKISGIKDITSLVFRIAKEYKYCARSLYKFLDNLKSGVLIVGTPFSGKTTLLRDIARHLSKKEKVVIIDERYEIAANYQGNIQMDIAESEVLSGFPKNLGILRAIRCLSPEIIICDEIGDLKETICIKETFNSGVKIIASIHAKDEMEILKKPQSLILLNSGAFEKLVILKPYSIGEIYKIIDVGDFLNDKNNRNTFNNYIRNINRSIYIT